MKKPILLFAAIVMASTGLWAETQKVSYLYPVYNTNSVATSGIKEWKSTSVDATIVENATEQVTWGVAEQETWYVVKGEDVQLTAGAICNGAVHLILADGAKLTATGITDEDNSIFTPGIHVSADGNSLTIYGQTAQSGKLEANGGRGGAGIGGGDEGSGSNITINGGRVTATGGQYGAGIGGGDGGSGSNITINGGTITANGGGHGAGIGGGLNKTGDNITINGGRVTATGGQYGAGIGGGDGGSGSNITINGGTITANGGYSKLGCDGAGIGGGNAAAGYNITINGGSVTANGGDSGAGIGGGDGGSGSNITINGGSVTANGGDSGSGIGGGGKGDSSNILVATTYLVKADKNNPPTTEIDNDGGDIADELVGKQFVFIESNQVLVDAIADALAAIKTAMGDFYDSDYLQSLVVAEIANINTAPKKETVTTNKIAAINKIEPIVEAFQFIVAKTFGTLGTKQDGPALIVTDKDGKEIILYSPKSVEYIKVKEEE